ncbi:Hypothetical protein GbCGDNIH3_5036 [Granulibacter bethesdensis]|uniref:Uncharacterized protein n=1 Tax=Granulibacter bethesdensis TaxID=364410 RepID=A0AAN0VH14_9PROT|nr:Hypothetical protein GbCGDNIH3_5036 [Granulibacter bethesdensis]
MLTRRILFDGPFVSGQAMDSLESLFADQVRKPGRTKSKDTKVVWSGLPPYLNEQKPSFIF